MQMILLIVLLSILLIGMIPLGIRVLYGQQGARAWVTLGPLRFRVYPKRKDKNKSVGQSAQKVDFESHAKAKKKSVKPTSFLPLARLVMDFLTDFRTRLRINDLQLKVILAGDDPSDLSIHYGQAWAALGNIMPHLDRYFVIKKRNVEILCDYTAESTQISGLLNMSITIGRIFSIGVYHGIKVLRKYIQISKNAKDGATL